jgi:hypothetical protein
LFAHVKKWVDCICNSLENATPYDPDIFDPGLRDSLDNRSLVLAQTLYDESLQKMPRPMQTLLHVLRELKIDISSDIVRQESNYEGREIAKIESTISFVNQVLGHTLSTIKASLNVYSDIDPKLECEVRSFLNQDSDPSQWIPLIRKKCAELRSLMHAELEKSCTKTPVIRETISSQSIDRVKSAVIASTTIRSRLKELSSGHLNEFFKEPETIEKVEQEEMPAISVQIHEDTIDSSKVTSGHALLRKIVSLFQSRLQLQRVLLDDTLLSSIHIMRANLRKLVHEPLKITDNADMKTADTKLQAEIKLLLQTISVDRDALDQVLRSTVTACESISQNANVESMTKLSITVTRWRRELTESNKKVFEALKIDI